MGDIRHEPSMEEILASIKRVIAEDRPAPPPESDAESDEDVLELDHPVAEASTLLSSDAAAASRERLAALSALRQRSDAAEGGPLEAVVREMLRPMLKQWLDEHMPEIVERLVTREIARISGRSA